MNFNGKISKIKNTLKNWSFRGLTLIGKITVIKSLALSQLVHVFNVVENNDVYLDQIEEIFNDFLWDGKNNKIASKTLFGNKFEGGLDMTQVHSFASSMKARWIQKLLDNEYDDLWKRIMLFELKPFGGCAIFNLNKLSLQSVAARIEDPFLKNIIMIWSNVVREPDSFGEFLEQPIWNNTLIKSGNNLLRNPKLIKSNVIRIKDIFDNITGDLKPENFFKRYDSNFHFISHEGLSRAIPQSWKDVIEENAPYNLNQCTNGFISKFKNSEKPSKFIYNILISKIKESPLGIQGKWESREWFDNSLSWADIYLIPHNCTEDTRLKSFQYNILMRAVYTNNKLFKANMHGTELCSFCNTFSENIEHLFFEYVKTRNLYFRLRDWIKEYTDIEIEINHNNMLFGIVSAIDSNTALNNIIILAKKFIFIQRAKGKTELDFNGLKNYIKYRVNVEKYSLQNTGTNAFERKWHHFRNMLN